MRETRAAASALEEDGISVEVLDLRSLAPFDAEAVVRSVDKTGRLVVVHEAPRTAGFGAEVAATVAERCLYSLQAPIQRVTGWDSVFPLKRSESQYLPSPGRIVRAARRTLEN
jgi:2-oxoisovalerate dehydrogenase E1 component beta subunit